MTLMERSMTAAKLLLLLLSCVLMMALIVAVTRLDGEMMEISGKAATFADHANVLAQDADERVQELRAPLLHAVEVEKKAGLVEDAALARVNELQPVEVRAGLVEDAALARVKELQSPIAETHSLLYDARASVSEMNRAALAERQYFEVQIPQTTDAINAAIAGLQPVEEGASKTLSAWTAISEDARKVADRETNAYLKPTPWYMQPVKRFGELWDVTAAIARHTP